MRERAIALGYALRHSSLLAYSSALQSYLAFCNTHELPVEPTEDTLSFYVVYTASHIRPSSVTNYLSGICNQLEPFFPNVRNARHSQLVTRTLRGCRKIHAAQPARKRPLLRSQLADVLIIYAASDDYDNMLFAAVLATAFHGLLRLGELVWPDHVDLQDWQRVTARDSVRLMPNGFSFSLPNSKTDHLYAGHEIVIAGCDAASDPVRPFRRYLAARDRIFPLLPQLWTRANGLVPTRSWFMRRLRAHFPADISGHSLRAGGATALAEDGIPLDYIQLLGRWSSDTFQIYIRKNPVVLTALLFHTSPSPS